jgi:hypothetical protein
MQSSGLRQIQPNEREAHAAVGPFSVINTMLSTKIPQNAIVNIIQDRLGNDKPRRAAGQVSSRSFVEGFARLDRDAAAA